MRLSDVNDDDGDTEIGGEGDDDEYIEISLIFRFGGH